MNVDNRYVTVVMRLHATCNMTQ